MVHCVYFRLQTVEQLKLENMLKHTKKREVDSCQNTDVYRFLQDVY